MASIRQGFKHLLLLGLANLLLSCNGSDARIAEYIEQGRQLFKSGDYKKAQAVFNNAIEIDPENMESRYQIAEVLDNLGDLQSAAGQYQAIINQDAGQLPARIKLGQIYLWASKTDAAEKMAREALRIDAENSDARILLGRIFAAKNNSDAAFVEAEAVLQKKPDDVPAITLLASLYGRSGKLDQAVTLLQQHIEKNPQVIAPSLLLADLYIQTKKADKAKRILESIVKIEPATLQHRKRLAFFLVNNGRVDDAEQVLRLAVNELPEDEQAKLLLADFLATQRKPEIAMAELIPMIEQHTENYQLRFKLADLQMAQNQLDKVEETLKEVIELDKNGIQSVRARNKLARLYAAGQRENEAKALVKELLDGNPGDIDARMLHGEFAIAGRLLTEAIADFRAILAEQPQNTKALKLLSATHLLANDPVLARENIEKVVQIRPKDETARLDLVNLLLKTGATEQAMQQLGVLFKLNPNSKKGREALFNIYLTQKQWAQAQQIAKQLEDAFSHEATGYYLSGLAYQAEGKYDKSIGRFLQAIDKQPEATEPLTQLVKSYLALKQPDKAINKLNEIIKKQPANVVAVNLLGGLYFQVNKMTEALNAYQKAITISPEWSSPYRSVALIHQMQNRKAEAIKALKAGIDHASGTMELITDLAAIYHEDGEHEKVLALYEQAYRQNPDSLTAINHLANYLSDYAKDGKALERAAKLAEPLANTGDPYMLDTVAWLAYKQGDYEKAEKILLKAVALNPAVPVSDYHLGMVYFKKGDSSHAREYLQKAISKKTDFNGLTEAEATLKSINAKG